MNLTSILVKKIIKRVIEEQTKDKKKKTQAMYL